MAGWDPNQISSVNLDLRRDDDVPMGLDQASISRTEAQSKFRQFLRTFRTDNNDCPYREQLNTNYVQGDYYITVDMQHLLSFDAELMNLLKTKPEEYMPVFSEAAKEVVASLQTPQPKLQDIPDIQVQLRNYPRFTGIRHLAAGDVSTLVSIQGIVVSAGKARLKATHLNIMCRNCKATKLIACGAGFGGARLPRECDTPTLPGSGMQKCPLDPYTIMADSSVYVDQQRLKLQENPESVPTGEMPRHLSLSLDRYLVGAVKPGTRITVVGIYTTFESRQSGRGSDRNAQSAGIRLPYLRALGVESDNESSDLMLGKFSSEDEEEMMAMSRMDGLYQHIANSIAPAIFGSEDIKKALAVQLFGGGRKHLPDGMKLRGDINVLLLGDPSVAKSQFLKFVHQIAPIGVYTSGKGSSAAGLTASVLRDPSSGEFQLEGGALVLADGGLVCIDEFDKMREEDRVAIHEAMEQQTISIAKAGIVTILNSRTSVLAAANPIFGRYDDFKSPTENIDFQSTILSRFDLIFIVRDVQDEKRDTALAKHVISVHRMTDTTPRLENKEAASVLDMEKIKKYIAFARARCAPRLSEAAAELLKSSYVKFRSTMREHKKESGGAAIPITVRQLEADVMHVQEALRLFQVSTFQAATSQYGESIGSPEFAQAVKKAEKYLDTRIAIGNTVKTHQIVNEMKRKNYDENAVNKAIMNEVMRQKFKFKAQGKMLERVRM